MCVGGSPDRSAAGRLPLHGPLALAALLAVASLARAAVPPAEGFRQAVVAADHPLASQAGVEVLRRGGNAVDAACAAAFVLGVVNPAGSGIGGGGFMLILRPTDKAPLVLDFRERAPAAAHARMFLRPGLPKDASAVGGLAVAVPGEVLGCAEAVRRHGKLRLAQVLAPAIRLAGRGFPAGRHLARVVAELKQPIGGHPQLAQLFLPGGKPIQPGQRVLRPRLARSLQAIARRGPAVFYRGWIAEDLVDAVRRAGGVVTRQDLAGYALTERTALTTHYRGYTVHTMPPPSSGGVAIVQVLGILERFDLRRIGHSSSEHLHLLAEAFKHAFADRARWLGDPDFVKIPLEHLTARGTIEQLGKRIGKRARPLASYGSGGPPPTPSTNEGGTSHISVVDREGTAVAMTTTINTSFGSMVVGETSGIILNNEMDDFATRPGEANAFGLMQGEQNAPAPGKRPLSSMTPTIVTREGKPVLVAGASGGPTIITGTLQAISNVLDFGLEARDAVCRTRIHHQWMPDKLVVERDLPLDVRAALRKRGQRVKPIDQPFTAVQIVVLRDGLRHGASDPRKLGAPAGY